MVKYILFMDILRQQEIETFYVASQKHRDFYRGYPNAHHPLTYFKEPQYMWQCPSEMSQVYLSYPSFHVKYKQPSVLLQSSERTLPLPSLPERCLAGRFNKGPCKRFVR